MKIFSAQQIHEWDAATIAEQQITGSMLMERASVAFTHALLKRIQPAGPILIVCGTGNNGGDGLCIARHLIQRGYVCTICIAGDIHSGSADAQLNYQRLLSLHADMHLLKDGDPLPAGDHTLLIDALFGSGLNRAVSGWYADVIHSMNAADALRVCVDIPSGLFADKVSSGAIVQADLTLTFEAPKLAFFFPENYLYTGDFEVIKIGLCASYMQQTHSSYAYVDHAFFGPLFTARAPFSHKGTYGSALAVAGNAGTPGAAALSAMACLKAGAGLVTLCTDAPEFSFPEIMYARRAEIAEVFTKKRINAMAIGPGLGTDADALEIMRTSLKLAAFPVVLDADAITLLALHPELKALIPADSILTPHPGEFERLAGKSADWEALLDNLKNTATALRSYIVYKQAFTIVMSPDGSCTFNGSGNPGMATAGSGDVLTGMLCALLAQGFAPETAARAGVYLHGLAGDLAMIEQQGQNLAAGEIADHISEAIATML